MQLTKDTFEVYLSKKDHINASDIKNFLRSPAYYYYCKYKQVPDKKKPGRHFLIGTAIHEAILEPHLINTHFVVSEKFKMNTKKGKLDYSEFIKNNPGKKILYQDEADMIQKIADNAKNNETLHSKLLNTTPELSIYTVDEKTGLKLRLRPDAYQNEGVDILDIKSTTESSPNNFSRDIFNYHYSITAAFYTTYAKKENYIFIAVEKEGPYQVSLFYLNDEKMDYGRKNVRMALDLIKFCYDNNHFPDYVSFHIMKECYELNQMNDYMQINETSEKILIL